MYVDAWCKSQAGKILSPLEGQIAAVVQQHPEYHEALRPDGTEKDYVPEGGQSNPFLHMGLHLAVREQVATDRPAGIASVHRNLSHKTGDPHEAEHQMIECLAESLWEAQSRQQPPDEQAYLERLRLI